MSTHTSHVLTVVSWVVPAVLAPAALVAMFVCPPGLPSTRAMVVEPTIEDVTEDTHIQPDVGSTEDTKASETSKHKSTERPASATSKPILTVRLLSATIDDLVDERKAKGVLRRYGGEVQKCVARLSVSEEIRAHVVLDFEPHWKKAGVPLDAIAPTTEAIPNAVLECFRKRLPRHLGTKPEAGKGGHVRAVYLVSSKAE